MGGKQLGFSDYELTTAKKQTKREKFLAEMEVVVPWPALITLIEPYYPKASKKGGRPPYPLATMLRIGRQASILAFSGLLSLVCGSGAQAMPITLEELVGKLVIGHAGDSVTVQTKYQDKTPFDMEYVGIKVITNEGGQVDEPYVSMDIRCDPRTKT